ncbi:hypothetical protein A0J48_004325 [Sphaerospermopsis aphanizomenoides BCCUSP55]|uniref:hypothetical protein n=1 Tax=Sphaerospermopsis aphanizomenoides TaxID=459663 RepID=UPI00190456CB|nr:hypothetical protein [Sphaerospermopsis aphanizomenoides]MBK1986775.1 hypothetical protein [Sphaerospermopsis aphanizomenoides BCCUSP55]
MNIITQILDSRKNSFVSEVAELSTSKFLNIRALSYSLGFIITSIENLDSSKLKDSFKPNLENIPSEWIIKETDKLISDQFDGYDLIDGFPKTTRLCNYLKSQLFIALMSELEDYLSHILELILLAYPDKLQSDNFNISHVLTQPNADELIKEKVTKKIINKQYGSPRQFFNFLVTTLDEKQTINHLISKQNISDPVIKQTKSQEISLEQFFSDYVEMKLRRNLGVHNGWMRNELYDSNILKYGGKIYSGDFLGINSFYFRQSMDVAIDIVSKCNMLCNFGFSATTL